MREGVRVRTGLSPRSGCSPPSPEPLGRLTGVRGECPGLPGSEERSERPVISLGCAKPPSPAKEGVRQRGNLYLIKGGGHKRAWYLRRNTAPVCMWMGMDKSQKEPCGRRNTSATGRAVCKYSMLWTGVGHGGFVVGFF